MRDELPPGWSAGQIDDLAVVNPPGSTVVTNDKNLVSFLPMAAITELTGHIDLSSKRPFGEVKKGFTRFKDGDVLFAKITPSMENGKIAVARDLEAGLGCGTTEFHVIRPESGVEADYLRYYLVRSAYRQEARRNMQGAVGQQRVPPDFIRESEIPVAPSGEQKRIVSKIDELFSRIDEGERALERVSRLVERYRQSVLKAAVTGELTRDWREKHKGKLESGKALLTRILTARREVWEQAELTKMQARGITPKDDNWKQKYKEPSPPDTADLPELPEGWVWASLDQLTSKITSGSRDWKDFYGRGNSVFVMAQNVRPRRLDLAEVQLVDPPEGDRDAQRSEVRQHDLLMTIVGANTGDVCRVQEPLVRHYVCQSVALARPVLLALASFAELYLSADEGGQAEFAKVIYGAGRPHLSFDQLRAIPIPLPPSVEQEAICNAVDLVESDIRVLARELGAAKLSSLALRQGVLRSAFRGDLVAQDLADEPATTLLERIATERATDTTAPKRGRKKKTTA